MTEGQTSAAGPFIMMQCNNPCMRPEQRASVRYMGKCAVPRQLWISLSPQEDPLLDPLLGVDDFPHTQMCAEEASLWFFSSSSEPAASGLGHCSSCIPSRSCRISGTARSA
ncbi:hypothetical protein ILYODFUR_037245 [Ilyodon furcidens]|uniref:Uncharacterized protein n=1 Tax=Ilyodon furcidens TaxID=33524 RepID=A0ABV0T4F7_9TELE